MIQYAMPNANIRIYYRDKPSMKIDIGICKDNVSISNTPQKDAIYSSQGTGEQVSGITNINSSTEISFNLMKINKEIKDFINNNFDKNSDKPENLLNLLITNDEEVLLQFKDCFFSKKVIADIPATMVDFSVPVELKGWIMNVNCFVNKV